MIFLFLRADTKPILKCVEGKKWCSFIHLIEQAGISLRTMASRATFLRLVYEFS